ncbi:DUF559 domain-containing protein [Rhizobium lusitanum]|uniref:DUF559 domain-containing protein n=1 Tax=Rhizobium lusitanum TaxID=293958 RepID=A0A6L9U0Q4_9HYPH|nr:DUF559 domain-containing protein [Rhizobium lusitanum]
MAADAAGIIHPRPSTAHHKGRAFVAAHSDRRYFADIACHRIGLSVELDGSQHAEDAARRCDAERMASLESQDYLPSDSGTPRSWMRLRPFRIRYLPLCSSDKFC